MAEIVEDDLATKQDIRETKQEIKELKNELAQMEYRLIIKLTAILVPALSLTIAVMTFMMKHL